MTIILEDYNKDLINKDENIVDFKFENIKEINIVNQKTEQIDYNLSSNIFFDNSLNKENDNLIEILQLNNMISRNRKSFLLEYLIEKLKIKYKNNEVIITATTSLVALLIGNFFQILPIPDRKGDKKSYKLYAFLSKAWNLVFQNHILLKHVFRQLDIFVVNGLNKIIDFFIEEKNTLKCINCETIFYRRDMMNLKMHIKKVHMNIWDKIKMYDKEYKLIVLYSDKKKVKFHNINKLNSLLESRILEFKSEDWSVALFSDLQDNELPLHEQLMKYLEKKNLANKMLCLKVGAKIISIYNDKENEKIVNSTFGKIVGFRSKIDN
ncbi:38611_t:CDS:2 [Gigaspora margarita]|uniref:38611_t:CDS:1 n=1 Tax=Gigaspora margarita TaxID=4874 RepID=A0ABN7UBG5_GIGMA|nr:38611_t:CDS:2 [Gigaspora margarita]